MPVQVGNKSPEYKVPGIVFFKKDIVEKLNKMLMIVVTFFVNVKVYLSKKMIFITGNVDYITRIGGIKKHGKVHPMFTVPGVIAGLKLFGFMGLIFGPLLISYFILLIRFYTKEFLASHTLAKGFVNNKT
jgi:hypothetical protein